MRVFTFGLIVILWVILLHFSRKSCSVILNTFHLKESPDGLHSLFSLLAVFVLTLLNLFTFSRIIKCRHELSSPYTFFNSFPFFIVILNQVFDIYSFILYLRSYKSTSIEVLFGFFQIAIELLIIILFSRQMQAFPLIFYFFSLQFTQLFLNIAQFFLIFEEELTNKTNIQSTQKKMNKTTIFFIIYIVVFFLLQIVAHVLILMRSWFVFYYITFSSLYFILFYCIFLI